jgi:hypothetical protein
MNNNYDPNLVLQIQRLLAAQQAQRVFETAHVPHPNPLLGQLLRANLQDQFLFNRPATLSFPGAISPAPDYGMLHAMMMMNNERASADRDRLLRIERANQERAARFMTDRVLQQERLIQSNERTLKSLEPSHSIFLRHQEATAVRDRLYAEIMERDQGRIVHTQPDQNTSKTKNKIQKEKKTKQDERWLAAYQEIRQYKEEHGDCIVPRGFTRNPRLAAWVVEQRKQYKLLQDGKTSSITPQRIKLLEEIGFIWKTRHHRIVPARRRTTKA